MGLCISVRKYPSIWYSICEYDVLVCVFYRATGFEQQAGLHTPGSEIFDYFSPETGEMRHKKNAIFGTTLRSAFCKVSLVFVEKNSLYIRRAGCAMLLYTLCILSGSTVCVCLSVCTCLCVRVPLKVCVLCVRYVCMFVRLR